MPTNPPTPVDKDGLVRILDVMPLFRAFVRGVQSNATNGWNDGNVAYAVSTFRSELEALARQATEPREANGTAPEPPLPSELHGHAGAGHAPGSAARDGSGVTDAEWLQSNGEIT